MPNRSLKDVLSKQPVVHLTLDDTVRVAALAMTDHRIGSVLVVDDERLAGIFTERDAIERVVAKGLNPDEVTLDMVMTPDPVALPLDATVMRALHAMRDGGLRHLPVVDGEDRVVGIVSMRDFVDNEVKAYDHEIAFHEAIAERIG
jgi:CBS domain-containing protein